MMLPQVPFIRKIKTLCAAACVFFAVAVQGSPIATDGSALFSYVNKSGLGDDAVFLQIVGENPLTGAQCFIAYDTQGNPSYFDVSGPVDSSAYAFPLSHFPHAGPREHALYLPQLNGARIYTSIRQKMVFPVVQNSMGAWTITAPNPLNPNDPNRSILWDKTEFAVNPSMIFINPTAVDNFSLPLRCEERGVDGSKQAGGIAARRKRVFNRITRAFKAAGGPWEALLSQTPSLVYSPMYGAATGIFPNDYFVTSGWLAAFKSTFSRTPLLIDAGESFPIDQGGGIWQGTINPANRVITFKRVVDDTHPPIPPVLITLPKTTNELIGGNGPSWKITTPLQAAFARDISCAVDTNTLTTSAPLSLHYFKSCSDTFYKRNPALPDKLQFIDWYSKVLHRFGDHQIYTIPYDDETGQSGSAAYTPGQFAGGTITLGPVR